MTEQEHNTLVEIVSEKLLNKEWYDFVATNQEYTGAYGDGEIDVVAMRGNVMHCYEIKSHYQKSNYAKARKQFQRMQDTFGGQYDMQFIYVSNEKTKRVRL